MADPLLRFSHELRDLGRRVLSVERRFVDLAQRGVRFFTDLEDVPEWDEFFTSPDSPPHEPALIPGPDGGYIVWGVGLGVNPEWVPVLIPEGGGGGGGEGTAGLPSMAIADEIWQWELESADGVGWVHITGNKAACPTAAGIYHVTAGVSFGTGTVRIRTTSTAGGWQTGRPGDPTCQPFPDVTGEHVSVDMPCVWFNDESPDVTGFQVIVSGDVGWWLQAHRVCDVDWIQGYCQT